MKIIKRYLRWWQIPIAVTLAVLLVALGSVSVVEKSLDGITGIGVGEKIITIGNPAYGAGTPDYTCDGVADDVQFQLAINALPATGGKIVIFGGTYVFANAVSRAIDNVTFEGVGRGANLTRDGVNPIFTTGVQSDWVFTNLRFDAGGVNDAGASVVTYQNVYIGGTYYAYDTSSDITADEWDIPSGRAATLTVAASDSDAVSIAQADYKTDGVADDVQIQAAIDAVTAIGGRVVLFEGTFTSGSITVNAPLVGQGKGTIIRLIADASTVTVNEEGRLRNLRVSVYDGYTGTAVIVEGYATGLGRVDVLDDIEIYNEGWSTPTVTGTGLRLDASAGTSIVLNSFGAVHVWGFEYSMVMDAAATRHTSGNTFESLILAQGKYLLTMSGAGTQYGNSFNSVLLQAYGGQTVDGINLAGFAPENKFLSVHAFDWGGATGDSLKIATGNYQIYAMGSLPDYEDNGYDNTIINTEIDSTKRSFDNLLFNGDFEVGAVPVGWTLQGGGATGGRSVVQNIINTYSVSLVRNGADCRWYESVGDPTRYRSRTVTFAGWVYATVANRALLSIDDWGVATGYSQYHSGVAGWEWLSTTLEISAGATRIDARAEVLTGNTTAYFDGLILVEGDYTPDFAPMPASYITEKTFTVNAFQYPNPGVDWTPQLEGAGLAANLAAKNAWIPLNFLKEGDYIVSYKLVGDAVEATALTLDCKLVRVNKANPLTTTDVAGGAIVQVSADGNFDVLATLATMEVVATDKQYVLEILGTTTGGDTITIIGVEVLVVRQ